MHIFYHTVLLICIYVVILLILLTINLFIFSTGLDYFNSSYIVHGIIVCKAPLSRFYPEKAL